MAQTAMANREARDFAMACIERLPFVVGDDNLERAQRHMLLAFGPAASPQLRECTPQSIGYAIALSAMSGLMPGGPMPDVWLIPRRNKKNQNRLEVNWQISARGYIRLARRAGWDLETALVFHGEEFELTRGTSPGIIHVPDVDTARGYDDIRLGYAVARGPSGEMKFAVLRKGQIDQRREKAETLAIWDEWPEEMALKTVAAYAGRREIFPCDPAARHAIEADSPPVEDVPRPTPPRLSVSALQEFPEQLPAAAVAPEQPSLTKKVTPKPEPAAEAEPASDPPMSDSDRKAFAKEMARLGEIDAFIAEHGIPDEWPASLAPACNAAIRAATEKARKP